MDQFILRSLGIGALQLIAIVLLAPLPQGLIKTVKARLQHRRGPSIFQPYYDLMKYWRKVAVVSDQASWLFTLTPYAVFGCMLAVAVLVPALGAAPLAGWDDFLVVLGILMLARAITVLAGLDTGSAFGGMGSSREMLLTGLVEPGLVVALAGMSLRATSTSLSAITQDSIARQGEVSPGSLLIGLAMVFILIAETGRLPVDNPDTHLELTMIHEGMILEYSGRPLAIMLWANWMKQFLLFILLVDIFILWGASTTGDATAVLFSAALLMAKVIGVAVGIGVIEMLEAKKRLFLLPRLLLGAFFVAALGIVLSSVLH
jgi:formate hydrogenlyase subunit 4